MKCFEIQTNDGIIYLSYSAVADIAAAAVLEDSNIVRMADIEGAIARGLRVSEEEGKCVLEVHVFAKHGAQLKTMAEETQLRVKTAVEAASGLTVSAVSVFIAGISFK